MTLIKYPEESRQYAFDFSPQIEVAAGATLTGTPTVTPSRIEGGGGQLTIGSIVIAGRTVSMRISGGSNNSVHQIVCSVSTNAGDTLAAIGLLLIARV